MGSLECDTYKISSVCSIFQLSEQARYVHLLKELLLSRQHLLQDALFTGALENLPSHKNKPEKRKRESKFTKYVTHIGPALFPGSSQRE